jgi:golgi-specific brefeldin A-resistance guanine nucleotide exchange factor 1
MHALVRTIFTRLHSLDPATEEAKLQMSDDDTQEGEIKLTVLTSAGPTNLAASEVNGGDQEVAVETSTIPEKKIKADEVESPGGSVSVSSKSECESSKSCS